MNFGKKAGYASTGKEFNAKINALELGQKGVFIPTGNFQVVVQEATEDSNLVTTTIDGIQYNVTGFIKMANKATINADRFDNIFLPKNRICMALDAVGECKTPEELAEKLKAAVQDQVKAWVKSGMHCRLFTTDKGRNSSTMVFDAANQPTTEQLQSWEKYNFFYNEESQYEGGSNSSRLDSSIFGDLGIETYSQGLLSYEEAVKVLKGWGSTVEELNTLRANKVGSRATA